MKRRAFLQGAGAAIAVAQLPAIAAAAESGDAALHTMLDGLATLPSPAAKLARVTAFRAGQLSRSAQLDLACAREGLTIDARIAAIMPFGEIGRTPYTVSLTSGAWRDAKALDAADRIAADTSRVRQEADAGIILPRVLLDKTITALGKASAATPALAGPLREQTAALAALRSRAGTDPGMWRLPHGAEYYDLLLDRQFGVRGGAAAFHLELTRHLETLTARADAVFARLRRREGTVAERFIALFRDPASLYPDSNAGRDQAVADMNRWLDAAKARVPAVIGVVSPECLNVAARRMTAADEAAAKAGYRVLPKADGTPGSYFVDLHDIRRRPSWSLCSVVHHELIPGHMIQMPMEARAAPHPLRLQYAPAFQEGWAIHAEQLMAEDGVYEGHDLMLLGHIHWLLFRIGRGIIDTGVHSARWGVAEAREKLGMLQGEPAFFASFDQDVERVCLEPASRAGEASAWLGMQSAQQEWQHNAATRAADLRRFHGELLIDGRMRRSMIGIGLEDFRRTRRAI